jgi:dipeptidyl aminopeptidase/acylaminoacyl peptidase
MPSARFDLEHYHAIPRASGLALSADGARLVTSVETVSTDGKRFVTSIWAVDPTGEGHPSRLTRSAPGEMKPAFLPDGSLVFISKRPDPDRKKQEREDLDDVAALWLLPAGGGEARLVAAPPGGVDGIAVADHTGQMVIGTSMLARSETPEQDAARRKARREADVTAILHDGYPIRFWDHDLGPGERRLLVGDLNDDGGAEFRDVTPEPARALDEQVFTVTPDGRTVVTGWTVPDNRILRRGDLVAIDVATGDRRVLASEPVTMHREPDVAPDGSAAVAVRTNLGSYEAPGDVTLIVVDLQSGDVRDLLPDFALWPAHPRWSADSTAVFFTADEQGRSPVFRVDIADGAVTRLCSSGAFTDLCPSPDGAHLYALRSAVDAPPTPVRLQTTGADQEFVPLLGPTPDLDLPGRLEEVFTTAIDGSPLRAWLVLPDDASPENPAPLLLCVHGGPRMSWNAWSWRWNPYLLASRGYAVLLPDPALSTGYGRDFVARGHGRWGDAPYTDLMLMTDAVLQRPDLDATRTAAIGGSFGGYMVNWIAGQTDRFNAIVTHASLWALDQFSGTTDDAYYWQLEFGDPDVHTERYEQWSPHRFVANIRTPMLVIHGDLDDRVPIGEALRLWTDLKRYDVPARFLFFPDENHWVLKPGNSRVWYETVFSFLDEHLLGKEFARPSLL